MIITRTPLRISLGGGGTDLPHYSDRHGGFLVAAAISKYVFIAVNPTFDDEILLKYRNVESVTDPVDIKHPLLRECLVHLGISHGVEISSMADIPAGTGLGSSGSFAVGVLRALHAHKHEIVSNRVLAEEACTIEIDRLREPIGKQDQYIAALGGITAFEFHKDGTVGAVSVRIPTEARHQIEDNLLLFFTGVRRSASDILAVERGPRSPQALDENLDAVKALGRESYAALEAGDLAAFAALLTRQWRLKYQRSPTPVHDQVDGWIRDGVAAGALGGKLVGAGGGGFLLFYADEKAGLRARMAEHGLEEVRFRVDYEGTTTIVAQ